MPKQTKLEDLEKLEQLLKLMQQYKVKSVKLGDIMVDGLMLEPVAEEPQEPKTKEELDDELLFLSTSN